MTTTVEVTTGSLVCETTFREKDYSLGECIDLLFGFRSAVGDVVYRSSFESVPLPSDVVNELERMTTAKAQAGLVVGSWNVLRISYNSPLDILLEAPLAIIVPGAGAALMALPTLVRRFSRLRVDLSRDKLDTAILMNEYERVVRNRDEDTLARSRSDRYELLASRQRSDTRESAVAARFLYQHVDRVVVRDGSTIADSDEPEDN